MVVGAQYIPFNREKIRNVTFGVRFVTKIDKQHSSQVIGTFYGLLLFALWLLCALNSKHFPWQVFPKMSPSLEFLFCFIFYKEKDMETEERLPQKNKTRIFLMHILYFLLTEFFLSVFP